MILLNSNSCLNCHNLDNHNKEIIKIFERIYTFEDLECALICKYQDYANKNKKQRIENCKFSEILDWIGTRDIKNGIDLYSDDNFLVLVLYRQTYFSQKNNRYHLLTEAVKILPYDNNHNFIGVLPILDNKPLKIIKNMEVIK